MKSRGWNITYQLSIKYTREAYSYAHVRLLARVIVETSSYLCQIQRYTTRFERHQEHGRLEVRHYTKVNTNLPNLVSGTTN